MKAGLLSALLLLPGCGSGGGHSDAERYVAAVGSARPQDCAPIDDALLRSECRAFAALELVRQGRVQEATETCDGVDPGSWRDECFFQLSDAIPAKGDQAKALCAQAGSYEGHCVAHALGREAQAILAGSEPGKEAQAFERVEALAVAWVGPRKGKARANGILRKSLAARFAPGEDFDQERCGTASFTLCRDAYSQLVVEASGAEDPQGRGRVDSIGQVCQQGPSIEVVHQARLPAWIPDAEPVGLAAWQELCRPGKGGMGIIPGQAPRAPGHNAPPRSP